MTQATQTPRLGVAMPQTDMGGDPGIVRTYTQAAEDLGFDHLVTYDHVLGGNPKTSDGYTGDGLFHDPFVLLGFMAACSQRIELSVQVLILPQRQTALVAKQAASLDVLSNGRLRLGVGVGWNEIEFVGLNENFKNRGRRSEEQVEVMRALWAEPFIAFEGKWHTIPDAGINPLPPRRNIPLWFGGHAEVTLKRIARLGDGWMPLAYAPGDEVNEEIAKLRRYTVAAGRDADAVGIDAWVSMGNEDPDQWRQEFKDWRDSGASHITLSTAFTGFHHQRIEGTTLDAHLEAIERYRDTVADLL
jgi:probable F420-dependent oxidoreductase